MRSYLVVSDCHDNHVAYLEPSHPTRLHLHMLMTQLAGLHADFLAINRFPIECTCRLGSKFLRDETEMASYGMPTSDWTWARYCK